MASSTLISGSFAALACAVTKRAQAPSGGQQIPLYDEFLHWWYPEILEAARTGKSSCDITVVNRQFRAAFTDLIDIAQKDAARMAQERLKALLKGRGFTVTHFGETGLADRMYSFTFRISWK